ncbi:MAG: UDP-N-acetylenolpyruvoylglucosamine reductase [Rhodospirillaceae bacterium]|nr:UDP-N-acetylenolpyruvoylglucosamine reductase [Rhodospirillaceae bacterium]
MRELTINHCLQKTLPAVRGKYSYNVSMAPFTWLRVGGLAEVIFRPIDAEDLIEFLAISAGTIPHTVIGAASNILVRDGGIPGVVIRLGKFFSGIRYSDKGTRIGSGLLNSHASKISARNGYAGLEFLSGIPGTIGGGLRMNAGAYGTEFKDILLEVEAVDALGQVHILPVDQLGMKYRTSGVPEDWIFLSGLFKTYQDEPSKIQNRMNKIQKHREASQPIREKTGGSTFTNPDGRKAWKLIDAAGCRGHRLGGAMVSEQHCNFLINLGNASAEDLENLGGHVQKCVLETSGIKLSWEIKRLGVVQHHNGELGGMEQ